MHTLECRIVSPLTAVQTLKAAKLSPIGDKICYQFITNLLSLRRSKTLPVCYAFLLSTSRISQKCDPTHSPNSFIFKESFFMNQLDGIKQFTTVVADSGDIESIRHYQPEDATTNPSLLLKAAGLSHFSHLIDDAITYGKQRGKTQEQQVAEASDKLAVNFGMDLFYAGFSNDLGPVRILRNIGLMAAERAGGLKRQALKYALGL
jgi:transaldolase